MVRLHWDRATYTCAPALINANATEKRLYWDRTHYSKPEAQVCALALSSTVYVGNLAFSTRTIHLRRHFEQVGRTLDDAAGEAFDKVSKHLGLGYPGGPALARLADQGNAAAISLPRPMIHSGNLDFSFSGLKTAVLTRLKDAQAQKIVSETLFADLAAATQEAIVDVLVSKSKAALDQTGLKRLVVAGGVGANRLLRQKLASVLEKRRAQAYFPPLELCTDNGAMIAFAAAQRIVRGLADLSAQQHGFDVRPRWDLATI